MSKFIDKIATAKHAITGQDVAKAVLKATKDEITVPKKKHVDYLVAVTDNPGINILDMSKMLLDRAHNAHWAVCFKALLSIHHFMNYGNEVFFQHMATNSLSMGQGGFSDTTNAVALHMSRFVRTYARYVNSKAVSFRLLGFDFCKVKKGSDDSYFGTLEPPQLLEPLNRLQAQIEDLLAFTVFPGELNNVIINLAYVTLSKDLTRLFTCYNDAADNLSKVFLQQDKKFCREALPAYKKYLEHVVKIHEFFGMSEEAGMNKTDIPEKSEVSTDSLELFENHLTALESGRKISTGTPPVLPGPEKILSTKRLSGASEKIVDLLCDEDVNNNNKVVEEVNGSADKKSNSLFDDDFLAISNNMQTALPNQDVSARANSSSHFGDLVSAGVNPAPTQSTPVVTPVLSPGVGSFLEPKKMYTHTPAPVPQQSGVASLDMSKLSLAPAYQSHGMPQQFPCYDVYLPPTSNVYPPNPSNGVPYGAHPPAMMYPGHFEQAYSPVPLRQPYAAYPPNMMYPTGQFEKPSNFTMLSQQQQPQQSAPKPKFPNPFFPSN